MRFTTLILSTFVALAPMCTYASVTTPRDFKGVVNFVLGYVQLIIPLIFALTFVVIIWGVVNTWLMQGGNTEKIAEGRMIALYGVIGLVVMAGLWGIIALLRTSLFGI